MKRAKKLHAQRARRQWFFPARRYAQKLRAWPNLEIGSYESVRFIETGVKK